MDISEALSISLDHFPHGPESVAAALGVRVISTPLKGADGWCVRFGNQATIRINTNTPITRQRFTLAHELAHYLLGTRPRARGVSPEPFGAETNSEKSADRLAAELLIPLDRLRPLVTEIPVDSKVLRKLAKAAAVSEIMAACRVAAVATEVGLHNAAVIGFEDFVQKWVWTTSLRISGDFASRLHEALSSSSLCYRYQETHGQVVVVSVLTNPLFHFHALFLQLLPPTLGEKQTTNERIHELAGWLFEKNNTLRGSLNGCISSFKNSRPHKTPLDQAVVEFYLKYFPKYAEIDADFQMKLSASKGREYVRLRLAAWFKH